MNNKLFWRLSFPVLKKFCYSSKFFFMLWILIFSNFAILDKFIFRSEKQNSNSKYLILKSVSIVILENRTHFESLKNKMLKIWLLEKPYILWFLKSHFFLFQSCFCFFFDKYILTIEKGFAFKIYIKMLQKILSKSFFYFKNRR